MSSFNKEYERLRYFHQSLSKYLGYSYFNSIFCCVFTTDSASSEGQWVVPAEEACSIRNATRGIVQGICFVSLEQHYCYHKRKGRLENLVIILIGYYMIR